MRSRYRERLKAIRLYSLVCVAIGAISLPFAHSL